MVTPDLSVGFVLIPGFTLTAFAGFVDALRIASDVGDRGRQMRCQWTVIGRDLRPVRSSCGATVSNTETFNHPGLFDYVVVIGGLASDDLEYDDSTLAYLRRAAGNSMSLVGVGTGVFVLARAGLLDGYRCSVHAYHDREFEQAFPRARTVADEIIVVDRDRLTCAGGTAAIDLAATLIEWHCGKDRALKLLPHLMLDHLRAPSLAEFPLTGDHVQVLDDRVRKAVFIMERHMSNPPGIQHIAGRVGSSMRQLERGFRRSFGVSPQTYYRTMRLKHGRWLLTHTTRSVTQIADDCGFADVSHFSRCFKRAFRQVPTALRNRPPNKTLSGRLENYRTGC